ncbi:insulin-degrading enzyme-like isoform X2 [Linepithema humile]|uniref:insulin-degrading enzyme-like isoform X2 n=1 Tax=Linepithema humile TaxID=83485 RepID=UPI000623016B|nr:PREDICTED: insulin-degrading enzyme-like [Linepithema humile]
MFCKSNSHPKLEDISLSKMRKTFNDLSQSTIFGSHSYVNEWMKVISQIHNNIKKPETDDRQYRVLRLANGLKICLISDPTTHQAAAALTIQFGYKQNHVEGFAHLYQHVLYASRPNNEFAKYVMKNSGIIDSQTLDETTTYYFDIKAEMFKQALEQFAGLFKALPKEVTDEYLEELLLGRMYDEDKETQQIVNYRLSKLFKWNIDSTHDMTKNKFGTIYTAYEKPILCVKDYLQLFFPVEYGADIMSLCVVGKESLDDLSAMILKFFFPLLRRRLLKSYLWHEPSCELIHKIWCRDIAVNESRLYIMYSVGDLDKRMAVERYFVYLLTYRGEKTFASVLESKGWITCIEAISHPCGSYYNFMNIGMKLTEEGLKHVDDIVALLFQYNNLLRKRITERWMYNEFKEIQELKFRYETRQSIMNDVRDISRKMLYCIDKELHNILRVGFVPYVWNKSNLECKISQLLNPLPQKIRIFVIDKRTKGHVQEDELTNIEPECSILYKAETISREMCTKWMKAHTELKLPARNEFIPTVAGLKPYSIIETRPKFYPAAINAEPFARVWYKRCPEFEAPKVNTIIHFICPHVFAKVNILHTHFNFMFVRLLKESLHDYVYAAALVDLKWEIYATANGIQIEINGFDNKQHVIIEKIIDRMINFKLDTDMFKVAKERNTELSISQLKKFKEDQPYNQAEEYLLHMLIDRPMKKEIWQQYEKVTFETFDKFISKLFSMVFVECLIHGNITPEEARNITELIEAKLSANAKRIPAKYLENMWLNERFFIVQEPEHLVFQAYNEHHLSSSTKVFYQIPKRDIRTDVLVQFIQKIMEERCYDWMSKNKLLDYYMHCGMLTTKITQGLTFLIHGSHEHVHLKMNEKIDEFIADMAHYIEHLSTEDFLKKKDEFIASRCSKPKTMTELSKAIWNETITRNYNFTRIQDSIECIKNIMPQEVYNFYQEFINKKTPKISVHITSIYNDKMKKMLPYNPKEVTVIDSIECFQGMFSSLKK